MDITAAAAAAATRQCVCSSIEKERRARIQVDSFWRQSQKIGPKALAISARTFHRINVGPKAYWQRDDDNLFKLYAEHTWLPTGERSTAKSSVLICVIVHAEQQASRLKMNRNLLGAQSPNPQFNYHPILSLSLQLVWPAFQPDQLTACLCVSVCMCAQPSDRQSLCQVVRWPLATCNTERASAQL